MDSFSIPSLHAQWLSNESELQRLRDLPAGYMDPAARERELDEIQDEIEWAVGVEWSRLRQLKDRST